MDMQFATLNELYNKLLPVLTTKVNELRLKGINYINENNIWNYHQIKWSKTINLIFSDMVSDILNTEDDNYVEYIKNIWKEHLDN